MTAAVGIAQSGTNSVSWRNRIINGDMRIDQRNAGASVTVNLNDAFFAVDRFVGIGQGSDGVFTMQRSTTAPTGFVNSLLATVTTADASIGATQQYYVAQNIEGFNVADLDWGTANAKTVTLSFWVRSSLTGTFSGALLNNAFDRSYPYTYTISAANTWEQKTVTIPGDTTGTWLTNNLTGIAVQWSLGAGASRSTTANAWSAGRFHAATGAVSPIATNGATFYITGVQLEVGTAATPFERRDYGRELIMCQRYYEELDVLWFTSPWPTSQISAFYKVSKRSSPTIGNFPATGSGGQYSSQANSNSIFLAVGNSANTGGRVTLSAEL